MELEEVKQGGAMENPLPSGEGRVDGWRLGGLVVLFALVLVATLWTAVLLKVEGERELMADSINRANSNLVRAFEEHTVRTLENVDQALLFVKQRYERTGGGADLGDYVREGLLKRETFHQIGIIDAQGLLAASSSGEVKPLYLGDREHFKVHAGRRDVGLYISQPVLGRASGKWSIQMTRRLEDADGGFAGVVVVSLDPFYFSRFYSEVDLGSNGVVALIGLDGVVRARRSGEDVSVGQNVSQGEVYRRLQSQPRGEFVSASQVDQVSRFMSYRVLKDYPVAVLVGVAEREAMSAFHRRARDSVVFAGAATAVIVLFSALLVLLVRRQESFADSLRLAHSRAESASRMKSQFLASMSHELRTPLNGILGYAEYLEQAASDRTQRHFAATILVSARHLLELVNSILDLAKIEAGRMRLDYAPERLLPLLQSVVGVHRAAAEQKGLALELVADPGLPEWIDCDRTKLTQVLNNLLHNAIKFTDHGHVTLHAATGGNSLLLLSVEDSGCGIEPDKQRLVFERFHQADDFVTRRHGGTGLGLALAKELVELMGGDIGLMSAPGRGTRVHFSLPLTAPEQGR